MLGICKKATISKDGTIVLDGVADKKALQERCEQTPIHTIASNAGVEGAVVVGKPLEQDDPDHGYDATKGEYVDMVKTGIIDPLKVIRTSLVDAASACSVASLMTTTEAVGVEISKEALAMGGGMDY
ncbi:unnamed protein product [Ilex paraguariensis]|uniref:Uncharacterized protein n=1 Tax=Ilex paraguariensis TaxID=185542 RepID=A0ABC8TAG1_9AQUA